MPSPRYLRELPARYRLEGSRCRACGKVSYPARPLCPACRSDAAEGVVLSPRGKVVTSTVVRVAPDDFNTETPYAVALVEVPEGARLTAQVVDCDPEQIRPGQEVALEFRLVRREGHGGILCYGHKAVPVGALP